MTKDEILKKHEDENEYHFHQVDREWIMEAMQEYADKQLIKDIREILDILDNVSYWEACPEDYKLRIQAIKEQFI